MSSYLLILHLRYKIYSCVNTKWKLEAKLSNCKPNCDFGQKNCNFIYIFFSHCSGQCITRDFIKAVFAIFYRHTEFLVSIRKKSTTYFKLTHPFNQ